MPQYVFSLKEIYTNKFINYTELVEKDYSQVNSSKTIKLICIIYFFEANIFSYKDRLIVQNLLIIASDGRFKINTDSKHFHVLSVSF